MVRHVNAHPTFSWLVPLAIVVAAGASPQLTDCSANTPICDAGGPYDAWCACAVEFDATGSTAPGGVIVSYIWDFGDGSTGEGPTPTHVYVTGYGLWATVTLSVTDGAARTSVCSTRVMGDCDTGALPPLECDVGGPYSGEVNEEIQFEGTAYVEESPTYTWDFGDGSTSSGATATHAYQETGEYTVTFEVADLLLYGCLEIPREDSSSTVASIGAHPVRPTTWGAIKATFKR